MCDDLESTDPCRGSSEESSASRGWPRRRLLASGAAIAGGLAAGPLAGSAAAARTGPRAADRGELDVLIVGGEVLDGTGRSSRRLDVGIKNGRIVEVGRLRRRRAARRIDATDRVVTPGFVDPHSHAADSGNGGLEDDDPLRRSAPNLVTQGITTVVVNQDGRSLPIREQRHVFQRPGIGINAIQLVGHGFVRGLAMGEDVERPAKRSEIREMQRIVRDNMAQGGWGLSAGLEYAPGRWSVTSEVVACAKAIVPFRGYYQSHPRSEA